MLLRNKSAIVSGASQGIGSAISLELGSMGANVCLLYRKHGREAEELVKQLKESDRNAMALSCDISSYAETGRIVDEVLKEFGRIDILVNNAGMNWDGVCWKMKEEQWDRVLEVNLKGYFNLTRHVAQLFKTQKYGKIVNVTSINGLRGKFGQSNYSAAKAGIIGFTKAVAKELGAFNVNVNAVAPGLIETPMLQNSDARDKIVDMAMAEMALKRLGTPKDVAQLVAFLASDNAKHITGEVIKVDGGQYI